VIDVFAVNRWTLLSSSEDVLVVVHTGIVVKYVSTCDPFILLSSFRSVGQKNQWKEHHKQICKSYGNYVSSECFQEMSENEKLDALLLTHLVAQVSSKPRSEDPHSPLSVFLSLMRNPGEGHKTPPICPIASISSLSNDYLDDLYGRFGNNNHIVHSHLIPYAHGIFPWASRLFNHSCSPTAVPRYIITACQPVRMELVSLRKIAEGEEVGSLSTVFEPIHQPPDHDPVYGSCDIFVASSAASTHELWFQMPV
jgi:hypothetical protein